MFLQVTAQMRNGLQEAYTNLEPLKSNTLTKSWNAIPSASWYWPFRPTQLLLPLYINLDLSEDRFCMALPK